MVLTEEGRYVEELFNFLQDHRRLLCENIPVNQHYLLLQQIIMERAEFHDLYLTLGNTDVKVCQMKE